MTSFKALGRLDSSRGRKERPEERQGCWGPQLHAICIAKAWLFGGGWKQPGDPSLGVWPRCFLGFLPRNTVQNVHFFWSTKNFQKQWWVPSAFEKLRVWQFLKFFAVCSEISAARLRKTCLLLPVSTCHQRLNPPHMLSANEFERKIFAFTDFFMIIFAQTTPQKKKGWLYTFMRDINLHNHSLVVCHHMSQQCVKIGLW